MHSNGTVMKHRQTAAGLVLKMLHACPMAYTLIRAKKV
jgi:hypothetical protein